MIYSTGTISINGNTATGSGTNWTAPASQVRAGQTIIVMSNPVQMFQISSVNSATSMTVTPAASPALSGQNYGILVSDNISVDGLALAMSQLIKEYDENIGAWETFATTSANQSITVTINGTAVTIPGIGKLAQKGSNGALAIADGGTGATKAEDALTNLGLGEGSALPVGVPVPWPSATPPTGWLKCNGAAFSAEEYPELAKAYPTNKLPDLRGEFIRGWDDGRGADSGRGLLSFQKATLVESFGLVRSTTTGSYRLVTRPTETVSDNTSNYMTTDYDSREGLYSPATAYPSIELLPNGAGAGAGFRVRPRNIAFNYIVRAA